MVGWGTTRSGTGVGRGTIRGGLRLKEVDADSVQIKCMCHTLSWPWTSSRTLTNCPANSVSSHLGFGHLLGCKQTAQPTGCLYFQTSQDGFPKAQSEIIFFQQHFHEGSDTPIPIL